MRTLKECFYGILCISILGGCGASSSSSSSTTSQGQMPTLVESDQADEALLDLGTSLNALIFANSASFKRHQLYGVDYRTFFVPVPVWKEMFIEGKVSCNKIVSPHQTDEMTKISFSLGQKFYSDVLHTWIIPTIGVSHAYEKMQTHFTLTAKTLDFWTSVAYRSDLQSQSIQMSMGFEMSDMPIRLMSHITYGLDNLSPLKNQEITYALGIECSF